MPYTHIILITCLISRWLEVVVYLLRGEAALLLWQLLVVVLLFEELVRRGEEGPLYAATFFKAAEHGSPTFIKRTPIISTRIQPTEKME
jgi:hypothetical protein